MGWGDIYNVFRLMIKFGNDYWIVDMFVIYKGNVFGNICINYSDIILGLG